MRALSLLILRALLRKAQWLSLQGIITEEAFRSVHFRLLFQQIRQMHEVSDEDLNIEALMSAVEIGWSGPQQEGMRAELEEIVMEMQEVEDIDPVLLDKQVREFVMKAGMLNAAEYVIENVHGSTFQPRRVAELVEQSMDVGTKVDADVLDYNDAALSASTDTGSVREPLGFTSELDDSIGGGTGRGELTVLLAPPARGKTSYLVKVGAAAARRGKGVLHITLEIRGSKVARRYDQALTGLSKEGIEEEVETVKAARDEVRRAGGRIWVKDWSHKNVTAADIKTLVRRMAARGQHVDHVVLDYLELLQSGADLGRNVAARHVYGNTGKETRAAAVDLDVWFTTAWQVNRAGSGNALLSERDVSECWDIVKHADTIIGLNQNPAMLEAKRLKLNIIKQREGTARPVFTIVSDLDRMIIRKRRLSDDGIPEPFDEEPEELTSETSHTKAD